MFEFMPEDGNKYRAVTESEAAALLRNCTRDSGKALERLRANHYAQLNCEGGRVRFNPSIAA